MNNSETIDLFIRNFVLEERRDRVVHELTKKPWEFTNRLNHKWADVLDMRHLSRIPAGENDFDFVKNKLQLANSEKCYVISHYDDIDNQVLEFKDGFYRCYGRGFATLIMTLPGDRLYLETEIEYGKQNRFIGKR